MHLCNFMEQRCCYSDATQSAWIVPITSKSHEKMHLKKMCLLMKIFTLLGAKLQANNNVQVS